MPNRTNEGNFTLLVESAAKGALPEDIQDQDKFKSTAREEF